MVGVSQHPAIPVKLDHMGVIFVVVVESVFLSIGMVREVLLGSFVTNQSSQEVCCWMFSVRSFRFHCGRFLSEHFVTVLTLMNSVSPRSHVCSQYLMMWVFTRRYRDRIVYLAGDEQQHRARVNPSSLMVLWTRVVTFFSCFSISLPPSGFCSSLSWI